MNHEECCQRVDRGAVARRPARLGAGHRPRARGAQQHRLAVPQRRPVLERLQQARRQVPARGAVHVVHDGRDGRLDAVPRHGDRAPRTRCSREMFHRIGRDESRHLQICLTILEKEWPGLTEDLKTHDHAAAPRRFRLPLDDPVGAAGQFWELPPYFLDNHRVLMDYAREAGLGVLSLRRAGRELADRDRAGCARSCSAGGSSSRRSPSSTSRASTSRRHHRRGHHPGLLIPLVWPEISLAPKRGAIDCCN